MFKKAVRRNLRLRLLMMGLPGSGKTMSALRVARGIAGPTGRVAVIDTDSGAAATKYADVVDADGQSLEFDHLPLGEVFGSFDTINYLKALKEAVAKGYDVVVIDSLTHAWSGKGGILEQKDRMGGKFQAWGKLTPKHRELVEGIVNAPVHVICTVRSKQAWGVDEKGRPSQMGLGADQRNGLEYEFDVVGEIDQDTHRMAITKSRCPAVADRTYDRPGLDFAEQLKGWLNGGEAPPRQVEPPKPAEPFDMPGASSVPRPVFDAVCQLKGWGDWATWDEEGQRRCIAENDFGQIARDAAERMKAQFHARIPKKPTKKEFGDDLEVAVQQHEATRKAALQAWYGVESATHLTLRHAVGKHGLRWLRPENSGSVIEAWDAVEHARLQEAA